MRENHLKLFNEIRAATRTVAADGDGFREALRSFSDLPPVEAGQELGFFES
jgi:hypothetical protein